MDDALQRLNTKRMLAYIGAEIKEAMKGYLSDNINRPGLEASVIKDTHDYLWRNYPQLTFSRDEITTTTENGCITVHFSDSLREQIESIPPLAGMLTRVPDPID